MGINSIFQIPHQPQCFLSMEILVNLIGPSWYSTLEYVTQSNLRLKGIIVYTQKDVIWVEYKRTLTSYER